MIEFNRDDKRILVSHSRYYNDAKRSAEQAEKDARRAEKQAASKAVKQVNSSNEKSTLGDLSAFSQLREQLKKEEEDKKGDA